MKRTSGVTVVRARTVHPSVVPLKRTLDLNTRLFLSCIDGVRDEAALERPGGRTNHIAFLAVHLLDARCYLARGAGLEAECPFKDVLEGAQGVEDIEDYPSLDAVREAWEDVSLRLSAHLETLTDADLEAKAGADFPIEGGGTVLGMLAFLTQHDSYHVGQIALLRRYIGLDAMKYP